MHINIMSGYGVSLIFTFIFLIDLVQSGDCTVSGKANAADIYYLAQPAQMATWSDQKNLEFAAPEPYNPGCTFTKLMVAT